jgi:hypothetical protein
LSDWLDGITYLNISPASSEMATAGPFEVGLPEKISSGERIGTGIKKRY